MRVFLDSNVLIGSLFEGGICGQVRALIIENGFQGIISEQVISEVKRISAKKLRFSEERIKSILLSFRNYEIAPSFENDKIKLSDADDIPILSAAVAAKADFFITGDKAILGLKKIGKMKILTPRNFLEKLSS